MKPASAGTQMTLVPSSRRSGTRVTPAKRGDPREVGGEGQVGVGDDDPADARRGQPGHAGLDRPVEAPLRLPHDQGAQVAGPRRPPRRRRTRRRRAGARPTATTCVGHGPGQRGPLGGAERRRQPQLGLAERLHRHEDGDRPERAARRPVSHSRTSKTLDHRLLAQQLDGRAPAPPGPGASAMPASMSPRRRPAGDGGALDQPAGVGRRR